MQYDLEQMKKRVKNDIALLIDKGKRNEANMLINEYLQLYKNDVEVLSIKAVLYILDGNSQEAEKILLKSLDIEKNHFDSNYNLAYIKELSQDYTMAVYYYYKALNNCNSKNLSCEIEEKLKFIKEEYGIGHDCFKNKESKASHKKRILFVQELPNLQIHNTAAVLKKRNINVDILYISTYTVQNYEVLEKFYSSIYTLKNVDEMLKFINSSNYDALYCSGKIECISALLTTNKPIIQSTDIMMVSKCPKSPNTNNLGIDNIVDYIVKFLEKVVEDKDNNKIISLLSKEELLEKIKHNFKLKRYRIIEEEVTQYKQKFGSDIKIIYYESLIHLENNNLKEAEKSIRLALGTDGKDFYLLYVLAQIQLKKKNYIGALFYYDKALEVCNSVDYKDEITTLVREIILILNQDVEVHKKSCLKNNKFLIIRSLYSTYITEFAKQLNEEYKMKFDLFTCDQKYGAELSSDILNELILYEQNASITAVENCIDALPYYDTINIHYLTPIYGLIADNIRKKCARLIITIWGSDFYRSGYDIREIQRSVLSKADIITFANPKVLEDFVNYYGEEFRRKTTINLFGLSMLDHIQSIDNISREQLKLKYNISPELVTVTCGYSASEAHNHLSIISSIKENKQYFNDKILLIFPMTYGRNEEYIKKVKAELENLDIQHIVIDRYVENEMMAELIKLSDIMIQVQNTDALSGAMQEHIFSRNLVITGEWLPYKVLEKKGVFFLKTNKIEEVGNTLVKIIDKLPEYKEKCINNRHLIYDMSSWRRVIEGWGDTFNLLNKNY